MNELLSESWQQHIASSIAHYAEMSYHAINCAASRYDSPSAVYRPRLTVDGNQWCALYGDNLQEGVAGFGDSPGAAMHDFDRQWEKRLQQVPA
jgi:hypothetical protein